VVVDRALDEEGRRAFRANGAHFLSPAESDALARVLVTSARLPNPALVGKSAAFIAEQAALTVPPGTRALMAELAGVGREFPLSIEKLCPVLSYYVVADWREGCERCKQILRYGGMGHTMSIHSRNESVILEFGLRKPAYRICVNTPTTHGSIGLTTGLDPAMTLGCGGFGGNITSDNISPRHLVNIKRVAYGIREVEVSGGARGAGAGSAGDAGAGSTRGAGSASYPLPKAPTPPVADPVSAGSLSARIAEFLASRGVASAPLAPPAPHAPPAPCSFVCEADVRAAVKAGTRILVGERTIITPAAREAGEHAGVFDWEGLRS
jgi:hypothetical protein